MLAAVWLRHYPTREALGYLSDASDSTALCPGRRCPPLPEAAGPDTVRMTDPGRARSRGPPALLRDTPGPAVPVETFGQWMRRPRRWQRAYYPGERKALAVKSQAAVEEEGRRVVNLADRWPGPWADIKVLRRPGLRRLLPPGVGVLGDFGYAGAHAWRPEGLGAAPGRKPRGKPRPGAGRRHNRALARRRVPVQRAVGRLWRYRALSQANRHRRRLHAARVRALTGLVNRLLDHKGDAQHEAPAAGAERRYREEGLMHLPRFLACVEGWGKYLDAGMQRQGKSA